MLTRKYTNRHSWCRRGSWNELTARPRRAISKAGIRTKCSAGLHMYMSILGIWAYTMCFIHLSQYDAEM